MGGVDDIDGQSGNDLVVLTPQTPLAPSTVARLAKVE
jgi:hypothetical protein